MFWKLLNYEYYFYRALLEKILSKKKGLVLDAGCGKGEGVSFQSSVGVDIEKENILIAKRKRLNTSFVVANLEHLPFKSDVFDGVISVDVLEHVVHKDEMIKEVARVTREGGFFAGSTSNYLNPILTIDTLAPQLLKPFEQRYAQGHYDRHFRFSPKTITSTFRRHGFEPSIYLLGFPLFNPWLYFNTKPPWFAPIWILFDRLTKRHPFNLLKETMLFHAFLVRASGN